MVLWKQRNESVNDPFEKCKICHSIAFHSDFFFPIYWNHSPRMKPWRNRTQFQREKNYIDWKVNTIIDDRIFTSDEFRSTHSEMEAKTQQRATFVWRSKPNDLEIEAHAIGRWTFIWGGLTEKWHKISKSLLIMVWIIQISGTHFATWHQWKWKNLSILTTFDTS